MNKQKRSVVAGAARLGLRMGKSELAMFDQYTEELLAWSNRINLTGHRDQESIEIFHYLDSLSLFQTGEIQKGMSILDVGSGAGFPGLPLKVLEPSLDLTLLESSEKRGLFLTHLVRTLGLKDVKVEISRAEDFGRKSTAAFDRILCRAVGSMVKVCSWTQALVQPAGLYLFQKSRRVDKEIRESQDSLKKLGVKVREVVPLSVHFLDRPRYAVIVEKI